MLALEANPSAACVLGAIPARLAFLVFLFLITALCAEFPQYGGWDVAAYMAIVRTDHSHGAVYDELRRSLPAAYYAELVGKSKSPFLGTHPGDVGDEYRRDMASNPTHFAQQLPLYRVKWLYLLLIWTLWKLGAGLYSATHLISLVTFFGSGLIVWRWLSLHMSEWAAAIVAVTTISQPGLVQAARSALPDALSIFLLISGSYFLWERNNYYHLGSMLLLLSVASRPDNLVFCLLALAASRKWVACLGAWAISLSILHFSGFAASWGWSKTFCHGFVHQLYAPAESVVHITPAVYISAVSFSAVNLLLHSGFLIFAMLGVWSLLGGKKESRVPIAVCLGTMFLHYLIFPDETDRFFVAQYIMILTILASSYVSVASRLLAVEHVIAGATSSQTKFFPQDA